MEDEGDFRARIFYHFREKHYNSMLVACKDAIAKFKIEICFHLYHALALMLNNRLEESINEFEAIKSENDVKLASTVAMMYANKMLGVSNKELFQSLDASLKELRKSAEGVDFYHAAFVLFVLNKLEKALDYVDKALSVQSGLLEAQALKGWILLYLRKYSQRGVQNIAETFVASLANNRRDLDAMLGLVESHLYSSSFDEALSTANRAVVRFPSSPLPLVLKMKVQLATLDWDQAIETMNRVMSQLPNDLESIKTNAVILLCRDANYEEGRTCIQKLTEEIEVEEPKNARLVVESAQLFSRVCGRYSGVLEETFGMVERAVQMEPNNAVSIVELGDQCWLAGRMREALKYYKTATKINEASLKALMGLTFCEVLDHGKTEQARKQVEFLLELEEAQNSAQLYLLRAKTAEHSEEALNFLKKACDLQMQAVKGHPFSDTYLRLLDPEFILSIAKEYLQYTSCSSSTKTTSSATTALEAALRATIKACPGLYEAVYLLAKVQYFNGDNAGAMSSLDQVLSKIDDGSSDAYLLMAQIQAQTGVFARASQSLEVGLSNNFKVRENPIYHYIRGVVDKNTDNLQDAVKSLTTALSLATTYKGSDQATLTLSERASIYIEMIDVHNMIGQSDDAAKLLEDAVEEFKGTPEEARILILSADHAIKRRNTQAAVDLLSKVKPTEFYYLQAKTKLAEVFLNYQMDKWAYLQCYEEMVADNPGPESYILLGDAYMNILEPDDALECYNKALQHNPKDPYLTSKMGKAYVETHYFAQAVAFYKDTIKLTQDPELKLQLADLYMNLKEYPKGEDLLLSEIEAEHDRKLEDVTYLQFKTRLLMLLAQIQERAGNQSSAINTLKDAKDNQSRVRKRLALEQSNVPEDETRLLVDICTKLADITTSIKNNDQAVQFYKEALEISPSDKEVLLALAKLYMQMNSLESCQQICANILKLDAEDEAASVMMADIAFRKVDFDMAQFHFTQLLVKQPTNWTALVRLVEIMRRTGTLDDFPEYLSNAQQSSSSKDPGLLFCTALYQWYTGNLNGALRNFNGARQDPEWGKKALYNMVEICLNPDDAMLGDQFVDSYDSEYRDSRSMALKTTDRLLKELKQRLESGGEDTFKYRLLVNFRLLATQDKHNIERALEDFIAVGSQQTYKDHVGPILGMSTAYTLLKQSQRAKNQLKRVAKATWAFEDAEYLERCWLLLADYYIQSNKYDVSTELLQKVVLHNKTCSKAFEYLGLIAEKEQHYKDAASSYESAWKFGGRSNPGVGYKLAYNLMKCKNYADAIDVGQQVLKLNPEYPKVKKEILDKSMNNLRI